jgi:hypothetical protein
VFAPACFWLAPRRRLVPAPGSRAAQAQGDFDCLKGADERFFVQTVTVQESTVDSLAFAHQLTNSCIHHYSLFRRAQYAASWVYYTVYINCMQTFIRVSCGSKREHQAWMACLQQRGCRDSP